MYNIKISTKVIHKIKLYTDTYRDFFQRTYQDSGIWSENAIIEGYEKESENRYYEIRNTLKSRLETSIPSYPNNQIIIRWRSKILLVSFTEKGDNRIITDLEIR